MTILKRIRRVRLTNRAIGGTAAAWMLCLMSPLLRAAETQPALSTSTVRVALQTQSKLWLRGDSTLHVYSSTATILDVSASFASAFSGSLYENLKSGGLIQLEVTVPVKEMKSGETGLDKNMQKSLKTVENPFIRFHLTGYHVDPIDGQHSTIKATGELEVAGVKKTVELEAAAMLEGERLRIQGAKKLLMTDYGIKPPTMMGLIKTKNEITIGFDLILGSQ